MLATFQSDKVARLHSAWSTTWRLEAALQCTAPAPDDNKKGCCVLLRLLLLRVRLVHPPPALIWAKPLHYWLARIFRSFPLIAHSFGERRSWSCARASLHRLPTLTWLQLFPYGGWSYGCAQIPSLAGCNLFYKQILKTQPEADWSNLLGTSSGVGVLPTCAIPQVGDNSVGNVAVIAAGGISAFIALILAVLAGNRQAAVGRAEMRFLFLMYGLCCVFQVLDVGAFLTNGTTALTWITGIHTGLVVGVFWCLAWLAFLAMQLVEDGTWQSIVPFFLGLIVLVVGSSYIALDTAFDVSGYFNTNPNDLHNAWLWSLVYVWPPAAAFFYLVVNISVVATVLREKKPIFLFLSTAIVFALGQGARFALSHRICSGTNARIDGSFVAVILETLSAILLYFSWKSITEDHWSPDDYADFTMTQDRTGRPSTDIDRETAYAPDDDLHAHPQDQHYGAYDYATRSEEPLYQQSNVNRYPSAIASASVYSHGTSAVGSGHGSYR